MAKQARAKPPYFSRENLEAACRHYDASARDALMMDSPNSEIEAAIYQALAMRAYADKLING
jgi:hypothetical protein